MCVLWLFNTRGRVEELKSQKGGLFCGGGYKRRVWRWDGMGIRS